MIDSAIDTFEKRFYQETYHQLSSKTRARLDALLESHDKQESDEEESNILTFRLNMEQRIPIKLKVS
ncbi:hypothetical protein ACFQDF_19960 [Ectobacillus funiculus]|uniref:Uncharacterized protein n=1 Tax=Ectobacillus funiculus TaxID=137993 RepID=A0ABV5WC52_9BACI